MSFDVERARRIAKTWWRDDQISLVLEDACDEIERLREMIACAEHVGVTFLEGEFVRKDGTTPRYYVQAPKEAHNDRHR